MMIPSNLCYVPLSVEFLGLTILPVFQPGPMTPLVFKPGPATHLVFKPD